MPLAVRAHRLRWLWLCCAILPYGRIVYGNYGFVVPNSRVGVSLTVAMALSCHIPVRAYR